MFFSILTRVARISLKISTFNTSGNQALPDLYIYIYTKEI